MKKSIFKNMQWSILICTILLIGIGIVALYSATQETQHDELKKQLMWLAIGIPVTICVIAIDYETIAKVSTFFLCCCSNFISISAFYKTYKWSYKLV